MRIDDLTEMRHIAVMEQQAWKKRQFTLVTMLADEWDTIWDDLSVQSGEPLVENLALETLTDRVGSAAQVIPQLLVPNRKGTKLDRAEKDAAKRRRVYQSYLEYSDYDYLRERLLMNRMIHGAIYTLPWIDEFAVDGRRLRPAEKHPYIKVVDPRQVYPLGHNTRNRLTSVIFTRIRRMSDIEAEWGASSPGVLEVQAGMAKQFAVERLSYVEETWYFDDTKWAVGVSARPVPINHNYYQYVTRYDAEPNKRIDAWLVPPTAHGLDACPVIERKRVTFDDNYRSELDSILPRLRQAQNLMARYLDQLYDNVYGPIIIQGIQNPDSYGPNAKLYGDGSGNAKVEYPRPTSDFEAQNTAMQQLDMARRQVMQPASRSGDPEGGWTTGRGQEKLLGGYSSMIAGAQRDVANVLRDSLSMCAHIDETWCTEEGVTKSVDVTEASLPSVESYNPKSLWKGDYKLSVTYGSATGLDPANHITTLAVADQLEIIPKRQLAQASGLVTDVLQAERDRWMEQATKASLAWIFAQAQEQNPGPLQRFYELVDDDRKTVQEAVAIVIKETRQAQQAPGPGMPPGPEGEGPMGNLMMAAQGQIDPSMALGQAGGQLADALPASLQRNVPGG